METGLLEDLCRGARISVNQAVLVSGFPEDMEPNEIEESLDAVGILGRVKVHTHIYSREVKSMVGLQIKLAPSSQTTSLCWLDSAPTLVLECCILLSTTASQALPAQVPPPPADCSVLHRGTSSVRCVTTEKRLRTTGLKDNIPSY
uniref:Paraneoplastic antigen Ma-like N-terminal domain-containing protein n=1 Tax=Pelusios castaneus TaxID=367368 RepID=A0A8C8S7N0_9SAUR